MKASPATRCGLPGQSLYISTTRSLGGDPILALPIRPTNPDGPLFLEERHLSFLGHLPLARKAAAFAAEHHGQQQRRGDNASYMLHLFEVASLLDRSGYPDHVVAGAILHDVLEDTDARRDELDAQFGREVGELVSLVSDDPAIPDEEQRKDDVRERVSRAGDEAAVLYAADKVSKVRELRLLMAAEPDNPEIEVRLDRYRKSLAMLEDKSPGNRLVVLLRFELEALQELPPQRSWSGASRATFEPATPTRTPETPR